ncbi:MAG: ASKHA domain-containing protein [Ardenticatenaceae bacterium]|nr:ASKHA domain-containing protein [Ardenticatenaceae bacterium]
MTEKAKHLVIFQPSGSRGALEEGTLLLEAARQLGVEIEATCGGRLMCSKCRVRIEEGFFERFGIDSGMDHLNLVLEKEKEFFASRGLVEPNWRQSCQAEVHGPVVVFVPEESRAVRQVVRKSARELKIPIKAAVRRYYVEMDAATLHDPTGDWERLQVALAAEHGLENLTVDYYTLVDLQRAVRDGDWKVTVHIWMGCEVIKVDPGFTEYGLGLAVDVGTTTVAGYLCDLDTGVVLGTASMMNPQTSYGDDVMARITYAMTQEGGLQRLHAAILEGLNEIVSQVCEVSGFQPTEIVEAVLVGNTCMDHIFLNIHPRYVGLSPFSPAIHHSVDLKARDFGLKIHPSGNVHVLPNEAGFVGADNVACIIAEEPHKQDEIMLLIDIGTNGEMVLGNSEKLISASVPTGPAFEGAQIRYGMRAADGAIEKIEIDPASWNVRFRVIGQEAWSDELPPEEVKARGICGSGIIDLGWELSKAGVVDQSGRFSKEGHHPRLRGEQERREFVIAWAHETAIGRDITFDVNDVRALQLAKAAMYSAAKIMMRRRGVERLDKVVLAGAFGSYIDKVKAMASGLFPDCEFNSVYAVGNAAGDGARIALLNIDKRAEANEVARHVEYVELTVEPDFEKQFAAAMHFPHMHDAFPHLDRLWDKARRDCNLRLLRNVGPLADLPDAVLRKLAAVVEEQRYRKNRRIFEQGGEPQALYIVREGQVTLLAKRNGAEEVVAQINEGAMFGGRAFLDGASHAISARSNTLNTRVLAIPALVLRPLLAELPHLHSRIAEYSFDEEVV